MHVRITNTTESVPEPPGHIQGISGDPAQIPERAAYSEGGRFREQYPSQRIRGLHAG